jgi:hypothetical protein
MVKVVTSVQHKRMGVSVINHQDFSIRDNINNNKAQGKDYTESGCATCEDKLANFFANTILAVSRKRSQGEQLNECEQELLSALEAIISSHES